jgi:hypothetical protein
MSQAARAGLEYQLQRYPKGLDSYNKKCLLLLWPVRHVEIAGHAEAFFNVDVLIKVTKMTHKTLFFGLFG